MQSTTKSPPRRLLRTRDMRERFGGVVPETLKRWVRAGILPEPLTINHVRYWDLREVEEFERARMKARGSLTSDKPTPQPLEAA